MTSDRHRFGQSPPPLVEYLQDILNRYPDGGQILKELIQNAEDAEASEVRFLYDRTQYGTGTLYSSKLEPCQGPALCAYNDACFTEEDWENIQTTARSVKKEDPMKIGRFGLGFNSVYHLTDLPMILSGHHIAILDPHESIFLIDGVRQSGRIWHLKDDAEEIKRLQDQFSPFKNLFEGAEDPFKTGFFNGTIFRFPLRQTPSRLSKTLYDYQKIVDFFESFRADGDIVLLFLHHVRSIRLMTRETTGQSTTDHRVSMTMSSYSEQERETRFTTEVKEALKVPVDSRDTVVSTRRFSIAVSGEPTRDWLVTSYVKGRGISEEARELSEELSLLPWVGVAMPLSGDGRFEGRTFCCLPLPAGHESTGLPVHVHGFFGVSDNRRSLKWTGTDQKSDSAARWNEVLVREILPSAYARLITDATKCCTKDILYAALPDLHNTAPHWDQALNPFFNNVLTQKVVWTPANGGKWITPTDAVFNRTSVPSAVVDYLVGSGLDVVTLPKHVMQAIDDTFPGPSLSKVTPGLLRTTMKKTGVQNSSRKHKLAWLQYALDDKKYDEMDGLELLPLADKTFTTFSKYDKTIFIESEEHPRTLLPGLQGRFLDTDTDIKPPVLHHLRTAATEAEGKARSYLPCLQLRHLTPQLVANHLGEALPPDWLQVSHVTWRPALAQQPPQGWLSQLWQYLQVHFPNDLSSFVGLPILPIVGMDAISLVRLEQPSKVIRPRYEEARMPDVIKKLVRDVDATMLEDVPAYLNHPKLEDYIHRCTPSGLLKLLQVVGVDKVVSKVDTMIPEAKCSLRAFFAKSGNLNDTERSLLAKLPIFEAVDDTDLKRRYLPALDTRGMMLQIAPLDLTTDPLPAGLSLPTTLIISNDFDSQALGRLVGLQQLSITRLLVEMMEKIRRKEYTRGQIDSLMLWILKNLQSLKRKDPSITNRIQTLAFVTTNGSTKVTPMDLFSPEEAVSAALLGEPVFPAPPYTDRSTLIALLELGMRQKLSSQDVLRSARNVQTFYSSGKLTLPDAKRKAKAIISALVPQMLTTPVNGVLLTAALMDVNFLPVRSERPGSYLPGLSWYPEKNNAIFVSPRDARVLECADLVGSTIPIVDGEVPDGFISAFQWSKQKLPIEKVVLQLKTICYHYNVSRPTKHHVVQILTEIYRHIDVRMKSGDKTALTLLSSGDFPPWVWHGDGLAAPNAVTLSSPFTPILDLAPYRFNLPEEFRDFKQMFRAAGVKESLDESDLIQTLHEIQSTPKLSTERDLKLSLSIIDWIVSHPQILEEVRDDILVPIATKDSSRLTLAPVCECTYNDVSWSDAQALLDDEDEEFKPLHKLVPLDTAQLLEVPSLSQRVVNAEEFGFDQCGQHEKVTQRLKNILNDYPEGAGIFKELIQNADDAKATEVKFLLDWRTNEDSREDLIDQGMAVCHGPALWAFNNATFSEEDFKNIQNLGGQTKLEALEKVGRFGVGFNSVYHVTDLPSFVSGSRVLFFDPHATHLSKHIKDKSRPGIGLDLQKNTRLVSRFKDQFKPFQGVFGYSTSTSYNGTLFRLPLRTPQEASDSEISDAVYSTPGNKNMKSLVESFKKGLKLLLLFTQNVTHVTMYTLDELSDPSKMVTTFEVSKTDMKYLREMQIPNHVLTGNKFQVQSNCLLATSDVMKRHGTKRKVEYPETSMVVKVTCREGNDDPVSEKWIISSCMGTAESLQLALSTNGRKAGLVPCGGVAAMLKSSDGSHANASVDDPPNGEAFCFLPLSIPTGLPVHVNGSFAVASNRRGLWEETSTDRNDLKVEWNKALMGDAVCKAYITMLLDLKDMAKKGLLTPYQYHSFWPNPSHITETTHYNVLVKAFYTALSSYDKPRALFESEGLWLSFTSTVFLDSGIAFSSEENIAARCALQQCLLDCTVVELPEWVRKGFQRADCDELLSKHTYTEERFYSELFFRRIRDLSDDIRDPLMLRILGRENEDYRDLIKTTACIPTSPRGQELSRPGDLIHPNGKVSKMFMPYDKKFPYGTTETYLKPSRLEILTELGMCKDDVPWEVVIERAKSVVDLNKVDQTKSLKRVVALMDFIVEKARKQTNKEQLKQVRKQLSRIPFLPIMQKPREWLFSWKGSEHAADALLSAHDLQPSKNYQIAGVSCPILCSKVVTEDGHGSRNNHYTVPGQLSKLLGLEDKSPDLNETLHNLQEIIKVNMNAISMREDIWEYTRKSYLATCKHLQKLCQESKLNSHKVAAELCDTPFIMSLGDKRFLSPTDVSFKLKFDGSPYLYQVPEELAKELHSLLSVCKVKEAFETCDFIRALDKLKDDKGDQRLSSDEVNLALELLKTASDLEGEDIREQELWIPDESGVLRRPSEVCYNDCAWMEQKDDMVFCHKDISRGLAVEKLGVKPVRHKALEAYSHNLICFGTDFGQVEKLTNRIKHLLDAYPFGKEILKELLQNADDAGATEIHFVFDKRQHGTKHIFDDSWKELQGPALCVYNNTPFKDSDLIGIQSLGEGSKAQDPVKTGKYGVGFNAVYHLTDCPSFMTGGDKLCIFDPQLRFVPGATQKHPGRMLNGVDDYLRQQYKDVFDCYLNDKPEFSSPNSTMFRFPLRATASDLSEKEVTEEMMMDLLRTFQRESFEVLLFVNSVEKIKISIIERDGTSREFYHAEAFITKEARQERKKFAKYVTECARSKEPLHTLPTHHVTYNLNLRDNKQHQETWMVHQRIGFEDKDIPNSIKDAHAANELGLLPRGGAAVCHIQCKQPYNTKAFLASRKYEECYHMGPKRAFCFLPLPIKTKLPVHVNGHFALDHEARRNLWRDEKSGMKSDWNKTLIKEVIAPAYAAVIDAKRALDFGVEQESPSASNAGSLQKALKVYHSLFPSVADMTDEWMELSKAFYQHINQKHLRLLPVLRTINMDSQPQSGTRRKHSNPQQTLEWLPPTGNGKDEAFFNTVKIDDPTYFVQVTPQKSKKTVLVETLLDLGFNLLSCPRTIFDSFTKSGVKVQGTLPESVAQFLQTHTADEPLCRIGASLPAPLSNTTFQQAEKLKVVLEYCLSAKQEETQEHTPHGRSPPDPSTQKQEHVHALHDLPLLLTADNILRAFDISSPVFATCYADLVPSVPEQFLHISCLSEVQGKKTDESVRCFDVKALRTLMPRVLDESVFGNGETVNLKQSPAMPSQCWTYLLWHFFEHEVHRNAAAKEAGQKGVIKEIMGLFAKWALLPACTHSKKAEQKLGVTSYRIPSVQPEERYLVPLCKARTVVTFDHESVSIQKTKVAEILRKLHCLELDTSCLHAPSSFAISSAALGLARRFVSSFTDHVGILRVLYFILVEQGGTAPSDTKEATELLQYFEEEAEKLKTDPENLRKLRSLPLYKTIHSKLISLTAARQCHVLPMGIPTADMDKWIKRSNAVFLEKNYKLEKLHEALGCSGITDAMVYEQYIFPNMDHISDEAVVVHLKYLRDLWHRLSKGARQSLIESLKPLPIIPSNGGRRPVGAFYDDTHPVFRQMIPVDDFLPECFLGGEEDEISEWKQFFIKLGLNNTVTKTMFLQYARNVERLAKEGRSQKGLLTQKSEVLVDHFFTMKELSEANFIEEVSRIRFITPVEVGTDLVKLHSQHGASGDVLPFVCFKNSVPEDRQELCWTSANILPDAANPTASKSIYYVPDSTKLCERLGIQVQPSMDTVISHVTCLCHHLVHQKATETEEGANSPSACQTLWRVMLNVYAFLLDKVSDDGSLKEKLGNVPCIVVEDGRRLVRPEQIAINLEAIYEIRPYLYGMPMELGLYNKVFVSLGAPEKPTPMQYTKVLEEFYVLSKGEQLDPNEKVGTYRAVRGLFHSLRPESLIHLGDGRPSQTQDIENALQGIRCLYLPSRQKRLQKSTDIVFDDTPQFGGRVKEGFNYPILVPLKDCYLFDDEHELVRRLPSHLRPKNLSSLVQEQLGDGDQTSCVMGTNCVLESRLTSLFLSTHFSQAIVRLSKHTYGDLCDEKKVTDTVEKFASSVKVCCKQQLTTRLVYKESQEQIKDSDGKTYCFIEDNTMYMAHTDSTSKGYNAFQWKLTRVVNNALGRPLTDLLPLMIVLCVDDPSDISRELDMADIKRYSSDQHQEPPLPVLGTPIPEIYHHLLTSNPAHYFTAGDYVGFEVYDPDLESDSSEEEEEYTMTFLYAQVIKEAPTDTELNFGLGRKYVIDVGHTKTVSAADLYKFCRPNVPGALVPYEGETDEEGATAAKPPQSLEEAMEEVSNILEEAWKLPEKERKKVVRRLYLQWHPDKNPDNVEMATEVCKHIQAEISRLEKGLPRKSAAGEAGSGSGDFGGSSFSSSFRRWNSHARHHRRQRNRFRERHRDGNFRGWRTSSGQWVPPRSDESDPSPREAARWRRQATADLQAARDNLRGPGTSHEWTCLMCHQAVEKALKAVQMGKFGKYEMGHEIGGMARVLEASCGGELAGVGDAAMELSSIGSSPGCDDVYLRARYPYLHPAPRVPHDMFTREHAERAVHLAQTILDMTRKVLN
ncbi:sacsin-like [Branchiostoma floridae]|uniref:Sacsin-like n=1 Tax=Branchiostoma floridae TaxID=7739 RepID=A0A9J7KQI9_BRAFL|nr:sacsin-like [Branchiostoma floridae]